MTSNPASPTMVSLPELDCAREPSVAFTRAEHALRAAGFGFTPECVGPEKDCPRLHWPVAA